MLPTALSICYNTLVHSSLDRVDQLKLGEWDCKVKEDDAIRASEDWLLVCEEDHEITYNPYGIPICSQTATEVCKTYGRHLVNTWIDVPNETCSAYIEALIIADSCK